MNFHKASIPNDLSRVSELVNSAYRGDYSKLGWTTEADLLDGQRTDPDSLLADIQNGFELFITLDSDTLISSVMLKEEGDEIYFGMLTVEPTQQGRGIGKFVLDQIEKLALDRKKKSIRLTVIHSRKELISFYERRGYQFTGNTSPFPENDPKFGLPKQKLHFLEYKKILLP